MISSADSTASLSTWNSIISQSTFLCDLVLGKYWISDNFESIIHKRTKL